MAASPNSRRHPSTSHSPRSSRPVRNNSRRTSPVTPPLPLPKGACNWRNLQQGAHSNTCGCRRFWSRAQSLQQEYGEHSERSISGIERTSCFCGHHACFHSEQQEPIDLNQATPADAEASQAMPPPEGAGRPRTASQSGYIPRSALRKAKTSPGRVRQDTSSVSRDSLFGEPRQPRRQKGDINHNQVDDNKAVVSGLGLYVESTRNQPFPSKFSTAAQFAVEQFPSTRTPSRMTPTELASERSAIVNSSPSRVFSDHITKQRASPLGLGIPPLQPMEGVHPDDIAQSATEIATPSNAGTPALRAADDAMDQIKEGIDTLHRDVARLHPSPQAIAQAFDGPSSRSQHSDRSHRNNAAASPLVPAPHSARGSKPSTLATLISNVASLRHILAEIPNLGVSLANLGQRVDALESVSFAHSAIEEHNDRFEHFDGRMLDIESRVDELEKFRADCVDSSDSLRSFREDSPSITRDVAHGEADAGPTPLVNMRSSYRDVGSRVTAIQRLRNIEERLSGLGSSNAQSVPTPTVEVILLPWGKHLQGVWHEPQNASQASNAGAQGATTEQTQSAMAKNTTDLLMSDAVLEEWPHNTLVARAIGHTAGGGGRAYERLKSRGFVRNTQLGDLTARGIYEAVCQTFGEVLRANPTAGSVPSKANVERHPHLLALRSAFIPLRKVHKHSRLRFLSESELTTPALWTYDFLESSVFMKAPKQGVTKLFITSPAGYLQDANAPGWTWQKLRELPRVKELDEPVKADTQDGVPEADACEPCWEHDARLDPASSQFSSFTSNVSFESSHHPSPPHSKPDAVDDDVEEDPDYEEGSAGESAAEFAEFADFSSSSDESEARSHHPAPITPVSDFPPSRPGQLQRRTASLPVTQAALSTFMPHISVAEPTHPKRQIASFDNVLTSSSNFEALLPSSRSISSLSKRRRLSRTPSGRVPIEDDAPWALTPRRSSNLENMVHDHDEVDEAEAAYQTHRARSVVKVPLKDRAGSAAAYATPYSFSGPGKLAQGDTDMDDSDEDSDSGDDANDNDDEDNDEEGSDEDPDFADEPSRSVESEMEMDALVTLEEEAWEGVGDDEDEDMDVLDKGKRKRVGHSRRKTGPRKKVADVQMSDDIDEEASDGEMADFEDEDDANEDAGHGAQEKGPFDDSDDSDDADELGVE